VINVGIAFKTPFVSPLPGQIAETSTCDIITPWLEIEGTILESLTNFIV
jgi:hypothetical protein